MATFGFGKTVLVAAVTAALAASGVASAHNGKSSTSNRSTASRHSNHGCGRNQVSGLDRQWLSTSIQGDVFEIRGGHLALDRSQLGAVRTLANTLISDHSQSLSDAISLARRLHIDYKTTPTPTQQWQLEETAELHGGTFNHDYSELEVLDHLQDIDESKMEVQYGCNPRVRHEAAKDIPTLQWHLTLSRRALAASPSGD